MKIIYNETKRKKHILERKKINVKFLNSKFIISFE